MSLNTLPDSIVHRLREFPPESLREEDSEEAGNCGDHAHDEDGSREPVDLEQVQQEADDASYPGHQGAGPHRLVPHHGREHLRRVDVDNGEAGAGPELPDEWEEDLETLETGVGGSLQQATDDAGHARHDLDIGWYRDIII